MAINNPNLIQEREKEFVQHIISVVTATSLMHSQISDEGHKTINAPHYEENLKNTIEDFKQFNRETLHLLLSDIIKRIEEGKKELKIYADRVNKDVLHHHYGRVEGWNDALDHSIAIIKEYMK